MPTVKPPTAFDQTDPRVVICGDCGARMRLVKPKPDPAKGWRARMFWGCTQFPACKGIHGAHQATGDPLGVPANEATRRARTEAHKVFDELWKTPGFMTRNFAYAWLTEQMGETTQVHIGSATIEECERITKLSMRKLSELSLSRQSVERRRKQKRKWKKSANGNLHAAIQRAEREDRKKERRGER